MDPASKVAAHLLSYRFSCPWHAFGRPNISVTVLGNAVCLSTSVFASGSVIAPRQSGKLRVKDVINSKAHAMCRVLPSPYCTPVRPFEDELVHG